MNLGRLKWIKIILTFIAEETMDNTYDFKGLFVGKTS